MNRFAWFVAALGLSLQAAGQTRYVNGDCGDDAWTGVSPDCVAPDGPKRTIQAAIPPGFTNARIVVAPGVYLGSVQVLRIDIDPPWNLTIESEAGPGGPETVIDGPAAGTAVATSGSFNTSLVLRGITIQNAEIGLSNNNRMRTHLHDCVVRDCQDGLRHSGAVTASDTIFENNIRAVNPMANLDRVGGTTLNRCIVRDTTEVAIGAGNRTGGAVVTNSLIVGNGTAGESAISVGPGSGVTLRNTTIAGNSGPAVFCNAAGGFSPTRLTAHNCILWDNNGGGDQVTFFQQGGVGSFTVDVRSCTVQGGFTGDGNLATDPLFADASGGDFHLSAGSPAIDSGNAFLVPFDVTTDLDGQPRIADDPAAANSGAPFPTYVDRGAYESGGRPYCVADTDDDHDVDLSDLAMMLSQFGTSGEGLAGDQDRSGVVDLADLAILLSQFGQACP